MRMHALDVTTPQPLLNVLPVGKCLLIAIPSATTETAINDAFSNIPPRRALYVSDK